MEIVRSRPALDENKKREIVAIVSVGCTRTTAARYVGCHVATIGRTAQRDPDFDLRLRHAEASHEILHLKTINSAGAEARYWRAAAWALERLHPDRYGARRPHTITADEVALVLGQVGEVLIEEIADEDCRHRILERLEELVAGMRDRSETEENLQVPPAEETQDDGQ